MPWLIVRLPCGSRSMQSTSWPDSAKATARLSVVVVFATPPFWLAKEITLARRVGFPFSSTAPPSERRPADRRERLLGGDPDLLVLVGDQLGVKRRGARLGRHLGDGLRDALHGDGLGGRFGDRFGGHIDGLDLLAVRLGGRRGLRGRSHRRALSFGVGRRGGRRRALGGGRHRVGAEIERLVEHRLGRLRKGAVAGFGGGRGAKSSMSGRVGAGSAAEKSHTLATIRTR